MDRAKIFYSSTLFILTILIWYNLFIAKYHDYDDNIADVIVAFFLSIISFVVLIIIWFTKRNIIKTNKWSTIVFLILNSPLTIVLMIIYYEQIFGHMKHC